MILEKAVSVVPIIINNFSKTPSSYSVNYMDISKADRDSLGNMHIDLINSKVKLELIWGKLTSEEMSSLLAALNSSISFEVTYYDPATNKNKAITCYKGDRKIPNISFVNGVPQYSNFAVNLIEL